MDQTYLWRQFQSVVTALQKRVAALETKEAVSSVNTTWTDLSLAAGWTDPTEAMQYKQIGDLVYLRGLVRKSSAIGSSDTILSLPTAIYPAQNTYLTVRIGTGTIRILISTSGIIQTQQTGSSATDMSLSNIVYASA
jgi:hypothetical protein